jgi:hypothetical protein
MRKPVYNQQYYKIQALLKNKEFQADVRWLKDEFDRFGVPIPDDGFTSYKDYEEWNVMFWEVFSIREQSADVKELWKKYANPEDNKIHTGEKYDKYQEEKAELVPPVYGDYLRSLASKHDFDYNNKDIREFLMSYVFFGRSELLEPLFMVSHKRNQKTNDWEMFIRVYPWTTKDDIVENWNVVNEEQARYPTHMKRNQPWSNFDRDYEILMLYEYARKLKSEGDKRNLEEITFSEYNKLHKDIDIDIANIKRIVSLARRRLGIGDTLSDDKP